MVPFLATLLFAADPSLADLGRFPTIDQANAQIGALIRVRYGLWQQKSTLERRGALDVNARQLAAWELLIEALGGRDAEEDYLASDEARRTALGRLRTILSDQDWREGRMP
jgi:hypothetical protein